MVRERRRKNLPVPERQPPVRPMHPNERARKHAV